MPLDGAMVATPPAGTTAVPNTVVASAPYNALKDDIYNIFNTKIQPLASGGSGSSTAIGAFDAFNTKGADIATAATVNLDTATGAFDDLTGTTTVTAVTLAAGKHRMTRAAGDFQITVGALLIGNGGGSNIAVKTGDLIIWEGYSGGVVRFWVIPSSGQPVVPALGKGYLYGLTLSNNASDAVNDIDIAAGEASSDGVTTALMTLASALTKQLDTAWSVGNNAGMRATGVAIADTTYHIFIIKRPDTGVVDLAADTSATGANIPGNTNAAYTLRRRIGSIIRESGVILAFSQTGNKFNRAPTLTVNVNNPGVAAVTRGMSVPIGIVVDALVSGHVFDDSAGGPTAVLLSPLSVADVAPIAGGIGTALAAALGAASDSAASFQMAVTTNTSGQIRTRLSFSDIDIYLRIQTDGWVDLGL